MVGNAAPFHCTTAPEANPLPFTVSVKPFPPAVTVEGLILAIVGGPAAMVSGNVFVTVCCGVELSAVVIVTLNVPAFIGVPPSAPPALRLRPGGKPTADQLYGVVPPCACIVAPG